MNVMSHSFTAKNGTVFNYDQGVEGAVRIVRRTGLNPFAVSIPADDLLEFVALCAIAPRRINEIEDMKWQQILGNTRKRSTSGDS
jgi:hypothetical protein